MQKSVYSYWSALIVALLLMIFGAGVVSAHAKLKSSVPEAGSYVASAPQRVTATFDNHDPLSADASLLKVTNAQGEQVDLGDTALEKSDADRKTLVVSLKSGLGNGNYTVEWVAVSEGDGSTEEGSFVFSVGAAPSALPTTGGADDLYALLFGLGMICVGVGLAVRTVRWAA